MLVLGPCFLTLALIFSGPCFKLWLVVNNDFAENLEIPGHLQAKTCAPSNLNEELPVFLCVCME